MAKTKFQRASAKRMQPRLLANLKSRHDVGLVYSVLATNKLLSASKATDVPPAPLFLVALATCAPPASHFPIFTSIQLCVLCMQICFACFCLFCRCFCSSLSLPISTSFLASTLENTSASFLGMAINYLTPVWLPLCLTRCLFFLFLTMKIHNFPVTFCAQTKPKASNLDCIICW